MLYRSILICNHLLYSPELRKLVAFAKKKEPNTHVSLLTKVFFNWQERKENWKHRIPITWRGKLNTYPNVGQVLDFGG
jgi:hypothetical protein